VAALASVASATERIADGGDRASLAAATGAAIAALERRVARADDSRGAAQERDTLRALGALAAILAEEQSGRNDAGGAGLDELSRRLETRFRLGDRVPVFVTGYHEPLLAARRRRDERFRFPLYGPPPARREKSARAQPGALPSRAEIERGALAGRGLELFWVDDPIELFFLHVQGSGQLELEDGSRVRVGFAATNGRPYRSIGSLLVARGEFARPQDATAPALKAWLRAHPDQAPAVLEANERFVFFRELEAHPRQGPPGALGAALVPYRSVAVDPGVTPLGSIGRLQVALPDGRELAQLVIAMDAGAAIRGRGRLDLFLGADRPAAEVAGLLRATGSIAWLEMGNPR